jgi:putative AdoMet-dependent methyltransferase
MKIKEVADKLKISARAIRFYEEKGLISPSKGDNTYREFSENEIWRLQTIISLREAGMAVEDIRKALLEMEEQNHEELQYYLELQRSVLFGKWLELKQIIDTTDFMIDMVKKQQTLPIDDIYSLAESSRKLREHRSSWQDKWNFDTRAGLHDEYVSQETSEYKDYEAALTLTVKWLAPVNGEKGLDIGTGTGNLAGKLMEQGAMMAGVDQSKEMLKRCRHKFPALETKLGNFLALPYMDGRFDFAVSTFAFHHLSESQKKLAIEEMRRVLRPHGRICITDLMLADEEDGGPAAEESTVESYGTLSGLLNLFEDMGYITKHQQINELLHIVYAVPIR